MDNYPDEYWYGLLLSKDSAARPLTSMQKSIIIKQKMLWRSAPGELSWQDGF